MNEEYMKKALKEANKAYKNGDVPIGAIIVKNDKIISKGYNRKEKDKISTYHAEILAIQKACKKLKTWHLDDCILYTTVEPCLMCCGAIIQSRINTVVFGTKNECFGNSNILKNNKIKVLPNILEKECLDIMQNFFKKLREKNDVSREILK